jgi:hypothetical protein
MASPIFLQRHPRSDRALDMRSACTVVTRSGKNPPARRLTTPAKDHDGFRESLLGYSRRV